jgi:hypothetical protein
MDAVTSYYYILIGGGLALLAGAFTGLAYSTKEERDIIKIFENAETTLSDRFIQPFRMHQNGKIQIKLSAKVEDDAVKQTTTFRAYLTDLYANVDIHYSYGPRYLEFDRLGEYSKSIDLKIGEYNLVFEKISGDSDIQVKYSLSLNYPQHPHSSFVDWALAFVDIGASMLLVGLTLYLGTRA